MPVQTHRRRGVINPTHRQPQLEKRVGSQHYVPVDLRPWNTLTIRRWCWLGLGADLNSTEKLVLNGNRSQTVQALSSCYTDYATPAATS